MAGSEDTSEQSGGSIRTSCQSTLLSAVVVVVVVYSAVRTATREKLKREQQSGWVLMSLVCSGTLVLSAALCLFVATNFTSSSFTNDAWQLPAWCPHTCVLLAALCSSISLSVTVGTWLFLFCFGLVYGIFPSAIVQGTWDIYLLLLNYSTYFTNDYYSSC